MQLFEQRGQEGQRETVDGVVEDPFDELWWLEPDTGDVGRSEDDLAEGGSAEGLDPDRIVRREAGEGRVALPSIQRRTAEGEDDRQALAVDGTEARGEVRNLVGSRPRDEVLGLVDEEHDPTAFRRDEPVDCCGERGLIGDKRRRVERRVEIVKGLGDPAQRLLSGLDGWEHHHALLQSQSRQHTSADQRRLAAAGGTDHQDRTRLRLGDPVEDPHALDVAPEEDRRVALLQTAKARVRREVRIPGERIHRMRGRSSQGRPEAGRRGWPAC